MKVIAEQDKCVSAGNCVAHAPQVFEQDEDDGSVILLDAHPPEDLAEPVREAAAACPAMAIRLET
ncbi:ferredoxin [Mycolicibacterium komossense]|uniref:Ferredoxin n=1 Tax=Mycolicibacterium komossense TaxID=1779 RepID=A0ABT3CHR9_9MYCO|nr:ferredoxin [Mycolicibacterium komossense]MCV7229000.1 ferredoxin [Mycolicibacterium komossense]